MDDITHLAVTIGPGLLGPLYTGLNTAKAISLFLQCPIIPVHHLQAHLEAIHLTENMTYPYLGLIVSGGHTLLLWVTSPHHMYQLGTTLDDAAGEAFDKGGKLLGLPYPAGRLIDELAKKGDPQRFSFPISLKKDPFHFSFSGVKTALKYFLDKNPSFKNMDSSTNQDFWDLCASYQQAIVEALVSKTMTTYEYLQKNGKGMSSETLPLVVGGGVACNSYLRKRFQEVLPHCCYFVAPRFCTDNGAMIVQHAASQLHHGVPFPQCLSLSSQARIPFPLYQDQTS
jgi:N6-L-threonylcarbamoyladenine synthase